MTRPRVPWGVWVLIVLLAASPLIQVLALTFDTRFLNFGRPSWLDALTHFVAAPWVAYLLVRRHARARFALYLFASLTVARGVRLQSWLLALLGLLTIAYVQLPTVRAIFPRIDPQAMRERWRSRLGR